MDKGNSDERLLKLIEGSSQHKQNAGVGLKKLSVNVLPAKLKSILEVIQKLKLNLFDFNKGLIGFACLLTLLFVFKLFSAVGSSGASDYSASIDAASLVKMTGVGQNQSTMRKAILSQDIKRNIFLPLGFKTDIIIEDTGGVNISEEIKDLKLVGIIWSDNPEVMIETSKDSRTYTLKKGDTFGNGKFKIKEITKNSVTLDVSTASKTVEYILR